MKAICVECWNPDALVVMHLDGDKLFHCNECGAEYGCAEVREKMEAMQRGWGKLLAWAEAYPAEQANDATT